MGDATSLSDEILTLQTGSLSNRLCLHFWNYEAYFPVRNNHSTDAPPSDLNMETPQMCNHTICEDRQGFLAPRALALDLASSIDYGFHFEDPANFQIQQNCSLWDGTIDSVFRSNLGTSDPRQSCRQWTVCFNQSIRNLWRENDMICTLSNSAYSLCSTVNSTDETGVLSLAEGFDALRPGSQLAVDVEDRIRHLLERCERPSALQLFTDAQTGFIGTSLRILDWWVDELPKRPVISFAMHDSRVIGTLEPRLQLAARANQMIFASRLESPDEGLTHATWIPLDLAAVSCPRNASVCMAPSLLAAGVSCMTTSMRLNPANGGLSPDDWIAASQHGHSRRMLTARLGFTSDDDSVLWQTVNPFARTRDGNCSAYTSSWREAVLRGIPMNPMGNRILQFAAAETGTERSMDLYDDLLNHSDAVNTYPRINPGVKVSLLSQLAHHPVQMTIPPLPHSPTTCGQPQTVHVASLLDAPGNGSTESKQLRLLVNSFRPYKSRSPLDGVELDQWCEFLESGQRHLVDVYEDT